ncbi:MAG: type III-A CRISPR-associated RAMP protein Csm3 [Bacillota bacterium]
MTELIMEGKLVMTGLIKACTGLHIGGSPTGLDIGGVDKSVIKDPGGKPYIPGSSLKGKMRSLLEKSEGLVTSSSLVVTKKGGIHDTIRMHMCNSPTCAVCNIFGRTNGRKKLADESDLNIENGTLPRLIVRDAYLVEDSIPREMKEHLDLEWTEVKFENSIDRITSAANPRQTERVPRGAEFSFQMVYTVYTPADRDDFSKVTKALRLLEDDYLGGAGSRGYGQILFHNLKLYWNSVNDYETGNINLATKEPWLAADTLSQLMEQMVEAGGVAGLKE